MLKLDARKKVAIFLISIGKEKGQHIIALMDNSEIKAIIPEIRKLTTIAAVTQASVLAELKELGYEEEMKPAETLTIIRFLFNGSKIGYLDN